MKVSFVTTNAHKFAEVREILREYPVELVHLNREYEENHDASIEDIAREAARTLAQELGEPVVVEDTGLFFAAYPNFPGALPKFVFNTLGYDGILKLLAGETREAYFRTVAAFCQPETEPQLFEGIMRGTITETVFDEAIDVMPYDRIFIPAGASETISRMAMAQKNSFSQRGQAFRKFGEYARRHASELA